MTSTTKRPRPRGAVGAGRLLRESEERYRTTIDAMGDAIHLVDRDLEILLVNQAFLRWTQALDLAHDLVGRTIFEAFPFLPPSLRAQYDQVFASGEPLVSQETSVVGAIEVVTETRKIPVVLDGRVERVVTVIRDVTERVRAEAELRRLSSELERRVVERTAQLEASNRELEAFGHSVSHDLRTPLCVIDGYAQSLELEADRLTEDGRRAVERIRGAAARMNRTIEDLLMLSGLTRRTPCRELLDLGAVASAVLEELRATAPQRAVEAVVPDGLFAEADPRLLRVALENLLGNAWKFTARREVARIEVGARPAAPGEGPGPVFFVRDDGAGFDAARADRLFSAFQRYHGQDEFPGTGVGLATVARVVRLHGGRVWATSTPGAGATLYFTLRGPAAPLG